MNILDLNCLESLKYDYIVIGSGPTGLTVAEKLIESRKKILLIDNKNELNQFEKRTSMSKIYKNKLQNKFIGGNALAWEFQIGLFQETDFKSYFLSNFNRDKLNNSINNIEKKFHVNLAKNNKYKINPTVNYYNNGIKIESVCTNIAKEKSWIKIFRKTLINKNLDFLFANLTFIECEENFARRLVLNNEKKVSIKSNTQLILCCGTLGNAKILQNCKTTRKTLNHDQIQLLSGVSDHPMLETLEFHNDGIKKLSLPVFHKSIITKRTLKKKYLVIKDERILGLFEIRPNFKLRQAQSPLTLFKKLINKISFIFNKYVFKPDSLAIWIQLVQDSDSAKSTAASIGENLKTTLSEEDLKNYQYLENAILNFMNDSNYTIKYKEKVSNVIQLNEKAQPAYHLSGSTKIVDSEFAFVDKNFRALGISNLFVQGASVFPESFWINPTFMVMSIADYFVDNILLSEKL